MFKSGLGNPFGRDNRLLVSSQPNRSSEQDSKGIVEDSVKTSTGAKVIQSQHLFLGLGLELSIRNANSDQVFFYRYSVNT